MDDPDPLDDLGLDLERVGLGWGSTRRACCRACTRWLLATSTPSTCTWPAATSSAARLRESPNIRAIAASTRSPASPSGTRTTRWSTAPVTRRVLVVGSWAVGSPEVTRLPSTAMPRNVVSRARRGADVDADVRDVEDRPVRHHEQVDHVAVHRARLAEDPVGEVAGDAGQEQAEAPGPRHAAEPPRDAAPRHAAMIASPVSTGVRDVGRAERGARVADEVQHEPLADQLDVTRSASGRRRRSWRRRRRRTPPGRPGRRSSR